MDVRARTQYIAHLGRERQPMVVLALVELAEEARRPRAVEAFEGLHVASGRIRLRELGCAGQREQLERRDLHHAPCHHKVEGHGREED